MRGSRCRGERGKKWVGGFSNLDENKRLKGLMVPILQRYPQKMIMGNEYESMVKEEPNE